MNPGVVIVILIWVLIIGWLVVECAREVRAWRRERRERHARLAALRAYYERPEPLSEPTHLASYYECESLYALPAREPRRPSGRWPL